MRIGHGYDVHRLTENRKLILGGVEIEFEKGLMDDYKSCQNKCIFCFIDQMPEGMRDTLVLDPVNHFFASVTPEEYMNMLIMSVTTGQSMD